MGSSSYIKLLPESRESNSSCNTFVDETLTDDAPPMRQLSTSSRSYCCNRFSSHALATSTTKTVVMMLAVYLLLPLGCLAIVQETNETSAILAKLPGAFVASQDVDNEISETLDEKPTIMEKTNFQESSLTENLEDTIRNSVKSEIEMEQTVGSPALLNAYNVLPETENIILVNYNGATTSAPKNEQPKEQSPESTSETQCEGSPSVCAITNRQDVSSTPIVNIIERIAATTIVPEIDILFSTTVDSLIEEATPLPESNIAQSIAQSLREGRTLEVPQNPTGENQTTLETVSQTSDNVEDSSTNNENNVENNVLGNVNEADIKETEQQNQTGEVQTQSEPKVHVEQVINNDQDVASNIQNESIVESVNESENQEIHDEPQEEKSNLIEPSVKVEKAEISNEPNNTTSTLPENEIQTPISVNEPIIQESEINGNEVVSQPSEGDKISDQFITQNGIESTILENEENQIETKIHPVPIEDTSSQNSNSETEISSNESNESNESSESSESSEISTTPAAIENNIDQLVTSDDENISATATHTVNQNSIIGTHGSIPPATPSSQSVIEQHTNVSLDNDTLSIVFEEPLSVTESTLPVVDDYIKTIIEMEDPLIRESLADHTTIRPEQPIHNVIKKQGVESIDIESPIDTTDLESEITTIASILNLPIDTSIEEAEVKKSLQLNVKHQEVDTVEDIDSVTSETVTTHKELSQTVTSPAESIAVDITEVSVVFPGKGDDDAGLNGKGSRSINALHHAPNQHKASINFDVYPAGQTFNENLAEELPNGIGKALPTHRLSEQSSNRSTLIIALCSCTALLFIVISVAIFMVSFQRQHGTLDIEMQEKRDNIHDDDAETCLKLLDIELPNTSLALQTDAEAEIEECL